MAGPVKQSRGPLARLVDQFGLAAFTPAEFFFVSRQVSVDPGRLVLVGGQALEVWSVLLDVPAPTGNHLPLTEDTDWLGSADDAEWLAELLGSNMEVELTRATLDNSTANTAVMLLHHKGTPSRVLLMDFLQSVTGLQEADIQKLAVQIDLPLENGLGTASIRVLHPIHCLASRMANLKAYESKRAGNGPMQAVWAVGILAAYLQESLRHADDKQVRNACMAVAKMAESDAAKFCYTDYGLDPLTAVAPAVVAAGGEVFANKGWPMAIHNIHKRRQQWVAWAAERDVRRQTAKCKT